MPATTYGASVSGLKRYTDLPIEYNYIDNLKDLIDRLMYIQAQEASSNNNFHKEKMSVVQFINDRTEDVVIRPDGLKYVLRCLSALPGHVVNGSGLFKDIINNLPFFPGTWNSPLQRLKRNDRGVNPLDEAARQHDIWYSKHKNIEDRWEAEKICRTKRSAVSLLRTLICPTPPPPLSARPKAYFERHCFLREPVFLFLYSQFTFFSS
ncbi:hypothetical protein J6590_082463 [Homalodisca vitripennis]|nr:hypothetical protein J6590_082463 [Homalodisca vitripennis]